MGIVEIAASLITLAALFSYINHRYLGMPPTIGIMVLSLATSLVLLGIGLFIPIVDSTAHGIVDSIDFNETLMHGMLAFLLFAGALHVNFNDLAERKIEVAIFSTVGVVFSTGLVAVMLYGLSQMLGFGLEFIHCLLFGALISPTDPIAVMGLMKKIGAPKSLETKLKGESLFNDGVGVVVFLVIASIAYPTNGHGEADIWGVLQLFAVEAIGGILFGIVAGWIAYQMLKKVDNYSVEVLITLALVMGGFTLANHMHTSGPLAMVVAGLLIGNHGRAYAMSDKTREHLDTFWELIDEILNAVLFVLIGIEVMIVSFTGEHMLAGLIAIPMVLLARFLATGIPISILRLRRTYSQNVVKVLTWGGLRGGISVALALAIPPGEIRDLILAITYAVVAFSIIVQGLTLKRLIPAIPEDERSMAEAAESH